MILPGISGSFILVIIGMYAPVLAAIAKAGHAPVAAPLFGAVCRMLPERRLEEVKLRRLITLARALATAKAAGVRLVASWPP